MSDIKTPLDYLCKIIDINAKKQKEELVEVYLREVFYETNRQNIQ